MTTPKINYKRQLTSSEFVNIYSYILPINQGYIQPSKSTLDHNTIPLME